MRIEIVKNQKGSVNGIKVRDYKVGEVFEVPSAEMSQDLADVFVREEWAKEIDLKPDENKQLNPPLEFKKMKVDELKVEAEKVGIEGFDDMKKDELVEALEKKAETTPDPS